MGPKDRVLFMQIQSVKALHTVLLQLSTYGVAAAVYSKEETVPDKNTRCIGFSLAYAADQM